MYLDNAASHLTHRDNLVQEMTYLCSWCVWKEVYDLFKVSSKQEKISSGFCFHYILWHMMPVLEQIGILASICQRLLKHKSLTFSWVWDHLYLIVFSFHKGPSCIS